MSAWQLEFLEDCAEAGRAFVGEGAFAPGPAIWVGKREIAHFDNERTLDVRLTKEAIRARRAALRSDDRVSLRSGSADWLEIHIRCDTDAEWACSIIRDAIAANLPSAPPGVPPTGTELDRRRRFH